PLSDPRPFEPEALLGRLIDGRFELQGVLGAGGMGAVYRARQLSMDRAVGLKVLVHGRAGDVISVERFRREAYLASRFAHPHAITIYDFGQTTDGLLYIAMELLEGQSLRARLRGGPLTARDAAKVTTELLRALAEAHRANLVHRDVKPDNIFLARVDEDPAYVKVLDFGIAKMVSADDAAPLAHLTQRGKVFGTAPYMSPEQIRGKPVDAKADLYAAGVVLYEMLCGQPPFVAEQPAEVLRMHLDLAPAPPSTRRAGVSPELERIALRALSKEPEARFRSADEFLEAVEGYKYNSGFYAVPARLAAMASVTEPGRRPSGADDSSDEHDAPSLGATMMLEQQRPGAAGPSPFEDDDPPFAEPPTAEPGGIEPESLSAVDLMDFSVSGDADERTMMEFTDDDPDERTQFEPEDQVAAPPVAVPMAAPLPPRVAEPLPVPQPAPVAQPVPVAAALPVPVAAALPAPVAPLPSPAYAAPVPAAPVMAAPVAAPVAVSGPLDSGFSHTVDALAGGDDEEDTVIS
ncbi:MAG: protein kinase, partial [Myxococcales bacterium]|nr:protein kinase [Myxococcales bacterium]